MSSMVFNPSELFDTLVSCLPHSASQCRKSVTQRRLLVWNAAKAAKLLSGGAGQGSLISALQVCCRSSA